MAVLGAGKIHTLDHLRSSLAQSMARMARKGIVIIIYSFDVVWLEHIQVKRSKEKTN